MYFTDKKIYSILSDWLDAFVAVAGMQVQSKGATWQPVTTVKTDEAATKAASLAAEEAKAEEVMERLRAVERAFGLRARGRAVGGGERGVPKGERGVEGESKCYLDAVVQGHGVRQSPTKAFAARGVHPEDCRWPQPPEAHPIFSRRSVLTLDRDLQAGVVVITIQSRSCPCFSESNATMV